MEPIKSLSDKTFQGEIEKSNGIDIFIIDLNRGKLELENAVHSDNFKI